MIVSTAERALFESAFGRMDFPGSALPSTDVAIEWGACPPSIADPRLEAAVCMASGTECLLTIPNIARFLISEGRRIRIDPAPDADPSAVRTLLEGTVFAALLCQRGLLVLRGTAVAVPGGAALILGPVATGKTTAAAWLAHRGFPVVSDSICAIRLEGSTPMVEPGPGRLHIWEASADQLGVNLNGLEPEHSGIARYAVPVQRLATAARVVSIFHLASVPSMTPSASPIDRLRLLSVSDHAGIFLGGATDDERVATIRLALAGIAAWTLPTAHPDRPAEAADQIANLLAP